MRSVAEIFRSYAFFDAEGLHVNGTDKESNHHYGDAYEEIIWLAFCGPDYPGEPDPRESVKLMMEIGVADGSCLLAWREVFPNATVVGMDIHPLPPAVKAVDRIEFRFGNQRSRIDCENAANGRQFDLIVEDATHRLVDTLLTLYWMWPFVKPGGLYVVEEWNVGEGGKGPVGDVDRIRALWPSAEVISTCGPHIHDEPLVVFRKPLR